jgi:hypothetical protein
METTISRKDFYQGAMFNGTMLGALWSIIYLLLFAGVGNTISLSLCLVLFFSSPFIAVKLAVYFRRKECDDTMSYLQAWLFTFYMYICATLLSALVSFIYFRFIDGGTFLMSLQNMIEEAMKLAGTNELLVQQYEQTMTLIAQITERDLVWQLMNNNLYSATFLPLVLALFIKKTK